MQGSFVVDLLEGRTEVSDRVCPVAHKTSYLPKTFVRFFFCLGQFVPPRNNAARRGMYVCINIRVILFCWAQFILPEKEKETIMSPEGEYVCIHICVIFFVFGTVHTANRKKGKNHVARTGTCMY